MIFFLLAEFAPPASMASPPSVSVDETLYVNLDYYGSISNLSIVKGCSLNGNREYLDYGHYEKVTNMTNTLAPILIGQDIPESADKSIFIPAVNSKNKAVNHVQTEVKRIFKACIIPKENNKTDTLGCVRWELGEMGKHRFYFQGDLNKNAVELPWKFDISYKLNGVPVKAEKLADSSGLIEMNIRILPNKSASQYYKNNMLLQSAAIMNMEDTYSIEAPGAQIQSVGTYKAVIFFALPGEETTFTIRVGTDHFESSGINMVMFPGTLDQLKYLKELKQAEYTIKTSADTICSAMNNILVTMESMSGGLAALNSGLNDLEEARNIISASRNDVYNNFDLTQNDLLLLSDQLKTIAPYMQTGQSFIKDINSNVNSIVDTLSEAKTTLAEFSRVLKRITNNLKKLRKILSSLKHDSADIQEIVTALSSDITALDKLLDQLDNDLSAIERNRNRLKSILDKQYPGTAGIPDEYIQALNKFLFETGKINMLQYTIEAGRKLSSSIKELIVLLNHCILACDDSAADTLLTELINIGDASASAVDTADKLIEEVENLNDTFNDYEDDALNFLADTEKLLRLTSKSMAETVNLMNSIETLLKNSGGKLDTGTQNTLKGLTELDTKSQDGLKQIPSIKNANNTIKDTIDKAFDKFERENMFMNINADAPPISFTSGKNPPPSSIQIIIRTQEITSDSISNNTDLEPKIKSPGFMERIKKIFCKIWDGIASAA